MPPRFQPLPPRQARSGHHRITPLRHIYPCRFDHSPIELSATDSSCQALSTTRSYLGSSRPESTTRLILPRVDADDPPLPYPNPLDEPDPSDTAPNLSDEPALRPTGPAQFRTRSHPTDRACPFQFTATPYRRTGPAPPHSCIDKPRLHQPAQVPTIRVVPTLSSSTPNAFDEPAPVRPVPIGPIPTNQTCPCLADSGLTASTDLAHPAQPHPDLVDVPCPLAPCPVE